MQPGFQELETFFSQYKSLSYKKREILLRPDDTPTGVFYLVKGYARLYAISETGEELTLIIFVPGTVFPLAFAFNHTENPYYLEAFTPIEVQKAPIATFLSFLHSSPDTFSKITSGILTRMSGILERMEYLVFGNSYQKTAAILALCANRFGIPHEAGTFLAIPLTHKDIGMLIGMTRETVSAEVKKLERKNLITYEGQHIVIPDTTKLKAEASLT